MSSSEVILNFWAVLSPHCLISFHWFSSAYRLISSEMNELRVWPFFRRKLSRRLSNAGSTETEITEVFLVCVVVIQSNTILPSDFCQIFET